MESRKRIVHPPAPLNEISGKKTNDTLTGTPGGDLILGLAGDDTLSGLGGNDILNGGNGADAMTGGLGNDIYIVDDAGDTVEEDPDAGNDTVRSWVDFSLADQAVNVEILALFGTADIDGTGTDRNNRLSGNSGANILIGLGGNDKINGGLGADDMRGGLGNDVYVVDDAGDAITEDADEGTDTVRSSVSYSLADQSAHLENLVLLGKGDIDGTGNARDNVLKGNAGANILIGGDGKDKLDGKAGADDLRGGKGDDIYIVDDILDRVTEEPGGGYDVVRSTVRFSLNEHSQQLEAVTLLGRDDVGALGNDKNNVIRGNDGKNFLLGFGGNDRIFGNGGNDRLSESEGDDFFNGGAGIDVVQFDSVISNFEIDMVRGKAGADVWRVRDINPDDGDTGFDRFVNVELLNFNGVVVNIGEKPFGYNHVPILGDDTLATDEDTVLRFRNTLWDNDIDPDDFLPRTGDVILPKITLDTTGTIGKVTLGSVIEQPSYDPRGRFDGLAEGETATDTFRYTVDDGYGGVATATVTVTITGRDDPEVAVGRTLTDWTAAELDFSDPENPRAVYRLPLTELLAKNTGDAPDIVARVQLYDDGWLTPTEDTARTKLGAIMRIVGDELVIEYNDIDQFKRSGDGPFGDGFRLGYTNTSATGISWDHADYRFVAEDLSVRFDSGIFIPDRAYFNGQTGGYGEEGVIPVPDSLIFGHDGKDGEDAAVQGGSWSHSLTGSDAGEVFFGLDTPNAGDGGLGGRAGDGSDGWFRFLQTTAGPVPSARTGFEGGDGGDGSDGGNVDYSIRAGGGDDIIYGGSMGRGGADGSGGARGKYGDTTSASYVAFGTTVTIHADGGAAGSPGQGGNGGDSKYLIDGGAGDDTIYAAKLPTVDFRNDKTFGSALYEVDGGGGDDTITYHDRSDGKVRPVGNYIIRGGAGDDTIQRTAEKLQFLYYGSLTTSEIDKAAAEEYGDNPLLADGGAGFDHFVYSSKLVVGGVFAPDFTFKSKVQMDYLSGIERFSYDLNFSSLDLTLSAAQVRDVSGGNSLYIDRQFDVRDSDGNLLDAWSIFEDTITLTDTGTWLRQATGIRDADGTVYDMYSTLLKPLEPATFLYVEQGIDVVLS